jgi:hypothetical protein
VAAAGDGFSADLDRALRDFLSQAPGRSFCDGCLAIELGVERLHVQWAVGDTVAALDRGHGRCSVCGQTLMVSRVIPG